ncbi:hypothetical protein [Pectobacterium carotovorum]|uniref:Uncharacterized protein n=1 Tax=Pectobacterium carotovorum TaxID=554 RepID=A0A419AUW9_PECCA|nr:hypothetical protein [Pectobacterium carotovorum]RJL50578.1 hypothetical protein D5071_13435 [Pectobacterium carotovorum]
MSVDINNLTGEETAEELEALLNNLGDVDISDDAAGTVINTGQTTADNLNGHIILYPIPRVMQSNKPDVFPLNPQLPKFFDSCQ